MERQEKCGAGVMCRFFNPLKPRPDYEDDSDRGECRKRSPVIYPPSEYDYGCWPVVTVGEWCGEHEEAG